jgi:1-acyl-sn-glycerol-3-phosphate acyltransferase
MIFLFIRSLIFNIVAWGGTFVIAILGTPLILLSKKYAAQIAFLWARFFMGVTKKLLGLTYVIEGRENVPEGPVILASKHQSTWETVAFVEIFPTVCFVLKKEIFWIPFFGRYTKLADMIAVDRSAGASALKQMILQAKAVLKKNRPILIFPEGSRSLPGQVGTYHAGIAALYKGLNVPVVPIALNAGYFWGRRSFLKKPGVITIQFLPPIYPGLSKDEFMATLKSSIESACALLPKGKGM